MFYHIINTGKEEIGLVWSGAGKNRQVERIYLPGDKEKVATRIIRDFPAITKTPRVMANGVGQRIADLYNGKRRKIGLNILNFSGLTEFSMRVLKQTCRIRRGEAATYSGLAAKVGHPRAVRAVGTVLAKNPFPIVIPCHRVVRAGGSLGQYGGGSVMKQQLLEKEGIVFDAPGVVPLRYVKAFQNFGPDFPCSK
jgi:methylated-DNA-[protein]-cysteine S-methyltransferase